MITALADVTVNVSVVVSGKGQRCVLTEWSLAWRWEFGSVIRCPLRGRDVVEGHGSHASILGQDDPKPRENPLALVVADFGL